MIELERLVWIDCYLKRIEKLKRQHKFISKRKKDIAYYRQRGEELEEIIFQLLIRHGEEIIPIGGRGFRGDDFITDISAGEFAFKMAQRVRDGRTKSTLHDSDSQAA